MKISFVIPCLMQPLYKNSLEVLRKKLKRLILINITILIDDGSIDETKKLAILKVKTLN